MTFNATRSQTKLALCALVGTDNVRKGPTPGSIAGRVTATSYVLAEPAIKDVVTVSLINIANPLASKLVLTEFCNAGATVAN